MPSSEEKSRWMLRWRYLMAPTSKQGIWQLKEGGYFVRVRVTDVRTGKRHQSAKILRGVTLSNAVQVRDQLRRDGHDRIAPKTPSRPLWSAYAASLFEAKVNEGKIKSPKNREHWASVLKRLVPAFGHLHVDELRTADIVAWRDQVARWIREGMPSVRKRDAGKRKMVKLAPVTANGWISILKVICTAMTKQYDLVRDPGKPIEYFSLPRTYTREQPNALTIKQMPLFLARMADSATAKALGARGGRAKAVRARLLSSSGLAELAADAAFAPYRAAGDAFVAAHLAALAEQAGGEVGPGPSSIVASAGVQLAASRFVSDRAAATGDPKLFGQASALANDSRQNLLAAYELAVREGKARAERNPGDPMARIRAQILAGAT